jgi:hypothetical protein
MLQRTITSLMTKPKLIFGLDMLFHRRCGRLVPGGRLSGRWQWGSHGRIK